MFLIFWKTFSRLGGDGIGEKIYGMLKAMW